MRQNGFTLVELMVAIMLLALISGVVILGVGEVGGGPKEPAMRFAMRVAAARDQAILAGQPISAWVAPSGYGFDRFRNGRWERLADKPFDGADWPAGTTVSYGAAAEGRARTRFDSLGLPDSPSSFRLVRNGQTAEVRIFANGDVKVD